MMMTTTTTTANPSSRAAFRTMVILLSASAMVVSAMLLHHPPLTQGFSRTLLPSRAILQTPILPRSTCTSPECKHRYSLVADDIIQNNSTAFTETTDNNDCTTCRGIHKDTPCPVIELDQAFTDTVFSAIKGDKKSFKVKDNDDDTSSSAVVKKKKLIIKKKAASPKKKKTPAEPADSIEQFEQDVRRVLELRSDFFDPTIPKTHHRLKSFTNTWTLAEWQRHSSRWRYVDNILSFPRSRILARTLPQLLVLVGWSFVACLLCDRFVSPSHLISLTPLSLVSTFVAALLTLRSNQGLSRLNEGRLALGKVVLYTRDMAQLIAANVYPKDPILGLKAARHVVLFSWLLKGFLRGEQVNGSDEDIIRVMLPCTRGERGKSTAVVDEECLGADAAFVMAQRKRPVAVVTRLRQIFAHMLEKGQLSTSEASRLDHTVQQLNYCVMITERIQASPIPPVYTAHTGRLLLFYLVHLPLALRGSQLLDTIGTVVTTAVVGYAMLGLDEISHMTEEPFRLMPLWQLCKNSLQDCGEALSRRPPSLFIDEDAEDPIEEWDTYCCNDDLEIEDLSP